MQGCKHLLLLCCFLFVISCDNSNNDRPDTDVKTANATPVANIGKDRTTLVGKKIQLNGYDSSDLEKTPLSYHWEVIKTPPRSNYSIEDNTSGEITFNTNLPGIYILGLHVSDGVLRSARDEVVITVTNTKPIAIPVLTGEQILGEIFFLNGSNSSDPDGHTLSYHWKLISQPENSTATISDATSPQASTNPDKPGAYVIHLIVSDGYESSEEAILVINIENDTPVPRIYPVANAGEPVLKSGREIFELNGNASYSPDGEQLSYLWEKIYPVNSSIEIVSPISERTIIRNFAANKNYVFRLTVSTPSGLSSSDIVSLSDKNTGLLCADCHDDKIAIGASAHPLGLPSAPADCGRCHLTDDWKIPPGAPFTQPVPHEEVASRCAECHIDIFLSKTSIHPITSIQCNACHSKKQWRPALKLEHSRIVADCNSCHTADKPVLHILTQKQCNLCHQKGAWTQTQGDTHDQSISACVACHARPIFSENPEFHIFKDKCDSCHESESWLRVWRLDHQLYLGGCVACHNNSIAQGKNNGHHPVSDKCHKCHAVGNWLPVYQFDHTQTTETCEVCHVTSRP